MTNCHSMTKAPTKHDRMTNRITFKKKVFTKAKVKKNLLKVWNSCDEYDRYDWYKDAQWFAIRLYEAWKATNPVDPTLLKVVGVIAALSPLKTWEQNQALASDFLLKGKRTGHFATAITKAKLIISVGVMHFKILDILSGEKTKSFYQNILNPGKIEAVTIDRHAISAAVGSKMVDASLTPKQYEFFVGCYKEVAFQEDVSPLRLQSAIWLKWRKG